MSSAEEQLYDACNWKSNYEKAKQIILANPNLDINFKLYYNRTALHRACYHGHADIVELLLSHFPNIDLNIEDDYQQTPLLLACWKGHAKVVKILLDDHRGVDINKLDNGDQTPLWWVACYGYLECVELLLAHIGISQQLDINTKSHYPNTTAKETAQREGKTEIVALLEAFEANPINIRCNLRMKLGFCLGKNFISFHFISFHFSIFDQDFHHFFIELNRI